MASEGYTDYPFSDQFLDDIKKDGVVGKAW
jgi:hypothetical protein